MEFLLLLWDELDDWAAACRHVASTAAAEFSVLTAPLAAGSAVTVWLLLPHFRLAALVLGSTATFWGAYRHLARLAA